MILIRCNVSVAMAVCNGEAFLKDQIDSIIKQFNDGDELIISYDVSIDNTYGIIKSLEAIHKQIRVVENKSKGVVNNFQNALNHCSKDIIFLSDQDDVWDLNKIKIMVEYLNSGKECCVIHDAYLVDSNLNIIEESTFKIRKTGKGLLRNFIRPGYIGCTMAFKRQLLMYALPIPNLSRSHDLWIGSIAYFLGGYKIINDRLIYHRLHENNVTPKKRPSIIYVIVRRSMIFVALLLRVIKLKWRKKWK